MHAGTPLQIGWLITLSCAGSGLCAFNNTDGSSTLTFANDAVTSIGALYLSKKAGLQQKTWLAAKKLVSSKNDC